MGCAASVPAADGYDPRAVGRTDAAPLALPAPARTTSGASGASGSSDAASASPSRGYSAAYSVDAMATVTSLTDSGALLGGKLTPRAAAAAAAAGYASSPAGDTTAGYAGGLVQDLPLQMPHKAAATQRKAAAAAAQQQQQQQQQHPQQPRRAADCRQRDQGEPDGLTVPDTPPQSGPHARPAALAAAPARPPAAAPAAAPREQLHIGSPPQQHHRYVHPRGSPPPAGPSAVPPAAGAPAADPSAEQQAEIDRKLLELQQQQEELQRELHAREAELAQRQQQLLQQARALRARSAAPAPGGGAAQSAPCNLAPPELCASMRLRQARAAGAAREAGGGHADGDPHAPDSPTYADHAGTLGGSPRGVRASGGAGTFDLAGAGAAAGRGPRGARLRERRGAAGSVFLQMQARLSQDLQALSVVSTRAAGLKHIGFGPFKRENQDEFFIQVGHFGGQPGGNLFCVFDGHGPYGKDAAAYSRQVLPSLLEDELGRFFKRNARAAHSSEAEATRGAVEVVINEVFGETERSLTKAGVNLANSGTTASVVYQLGNRLWVAAAGDSRAVMCSRSPRGGSRFAARPLTADHRPSRGDERARVEAAGARVQPRLLPSGRRVGEPRLWLQEAASPGLLLSRSLGDLVAATVGCTSDPEITYVTLEPGADQFVVVASDGVWDVLSNEQVCDIVSASPDPHIACRRVLDAALEEWEERMQADNITVLVVELDWRWVVQDLPASVTCSSKEAAAAAVARAMTESGQHILPDAEHLPAIREAEAPYSGDFDVPASRDW